MLIQVIGGPTVGYEQFTFPDGQRHLTLDSEIRAREVVVTASITDADSLFDLLLLKDILDNTLNKTALRVEYLMGGRMDRRIDDCQPFTLKVVADVIRAAGFTYIQVVDPHSDMTLNLLVASPIYQMADLYAVLANYAPPQVAIVIPDSGATTRVKAMLFGSDFKTIVQCKKKRDSQTGKLSGFDIGDAKRVVKGKQCLIIDDICDGGGTFVALAKLLREAGAFSVDLFVTHGIFSKGRELEGIDNVFSTDSFKGRVHPKQSGTRVEAD